MGKHTQVGTTIDVTHDDLTEDLDVIVVGADTFYHVQLVALEDDGNAVRLLVTGTEDNVVGFLTDYFTGDRDLAILHMSMNHAAFI